MATEESKVFNLWDIFNEVHSAKADLSIVYHCEGVMEVIVRATGGSCTTVSRHFTAIEMTIDKLSADIMHMIHILKKRIEANV